MADCYGVPEDNRHIDLIVEYTGDIEDVYTRYKDHCVTPVNSRYAVMYLEEETTYESDELSYNTIPKCYALMDDVVLEDAGIGQVRRSGLDLTGQGILVAVIDTGIDFTNEAFRYEDGTSKIISIWDQTIEDSEKKSIFKYGTEYTKEQIEEALKSSNPGQIIPTTDTSGHGTYLAGLVGGNSNEDEGFFGIAPNASFVVVKLREASQALKDFYRISSDKEAYGEADIMLGIRYATLIATKEKKPLVILIALGSSLTPHLGTEPLGQYLGDLAITRGVAVVCSGGNEGEAAHHYAGEVAEESSQVELRVGENEAGFSLGFWGYPPNRFFIEIQSPSGQRTGQVGIGQRGRQSFHFLLEETAIVIDYYVADSYSGITTIIMRFSKPSKGIWNIYVTDENIGSRRFDMWLPVTDFISEDTFFLEATPYNTLVSPSTSISVMCVGNYNQNSQRIYLTSSRGFPPNSIKPDFVAPGVEVLGPLPRNRYGRRTGSSVSTAVVAGMSVLLLEWGQVNRNETTMNTTVISNYLIRGATRDDSRIYPNRQWGYGVVDLYQTFLQIR